MQMTESNGAETLDMWTDDFQKLVIFVWHYIMSTTSGSCRSKCFAHLNGAAICAKQQITSDQPSCKHYVNSVLKSSFPNWCMWLTEVQTLLRPSAQLQGWIAQHTSWTQCCIPHLGKPAENDLSGEEVSARIDSTKSLVTYFKQTHLQNRLEKTLKASVETRCNSLCTMLDSISSQYEGIRTLLEQRGEENRLNCINTETLSHIVAFLARFKEATKALEASKLQPFTWQLCGWSSSDVTFHQQSDTVIAERKMPHSFEWQVSAASPAQAYNVLASQAEKPEAACRPKWSDEHSQRSTTSCER